MIRDGDFFLGQCPRNRIRTNAFWSSVLGGELPPPVGAATFCTGSTTLVVSCPRQPLRNIIHADRNLHTIPRTAGQRSRLSERRGWSFPRYCSQPNPNQISTGLCCTLRRGCPYLLDFRPGSVSGLTSSNEPSNPFHHPTQFDLHPGDAKVQKLAIYFVGHV